MKGAHAHMLNPLRHREKVAHTESVFGNDVFGRSAEKFARFFGTPKFILGQTAVVALWIALNAAAIIGRWDPYPFILLNLLFSTQAAYAAPLILLAQTRQADRDKATAEADAHHREDVAARQAGMLAQNTDITTQVHDMTARIETAVALLDEIHRHVAALAPEAGKFPPGEAVAGA